MKKYFIFAAVAAAGLLTSCSSSDDAISEGPNSPIENDGRVAIQIGVGSPAGTAVTRGTGTAGGTGTGADANIWRGERVHVLMYQIAEGLPTFNFTNAEGTSTPLYDQTALLVTPLKDENLATGIAKEPTNPVSIGAGETFKVKYYPVIGQSDFWGYYLGGYDSDPATANDGDEPAGTGAIAGYTYAAPTGTSKNPTLTAATSTDKADVMATDFTIDGTHDLLVGQAPQGTDLTAAINAIDPAPSNLDNMLAAVPSAYSAKTARQGIQPDIKFNHLLSRLQFKATAGNAKAQGVRVTAIKVRSKDTGKMIVAYKYKDADGAVDYDTSTDGTQAPIRIAWDADQEALQYNATVSEGVYSWVDADEDEYNTAAAAGGAGVVNLADGVTFPTDVLITANKDKVYKQSLEGQTAGVYDQITYKRIKEDEAPHAALPQLSLKRRIATGDVLSLATYKFEDSDKSAYDNAGAANQIDQVGSAPAAIKNSLLKASNVNKYVKYWPADTDDDDVVDEDELAYQKIVEDEAQTTAGAADDGKMKDLLPVSLTWTDANTDNVNDDAPQAIGEALLVAPQQKYDIVVEYEMDKHVAQKWYSDPQAGNTPGEYIDDPADTPIIAALHTDLERTATETVGNENVAKAFAAGESYLITITLYGPEQIVINTTLTAWTASDDDIAIGQD